MIEIPFYNEHILEYNFPTQIAFTLVLNLIATELIELEKADDETGEINQLQDSLYVDSYLDLE